MPTQTTQSSTQIDLADFDQFKSLMQTLVTKLEDFQPGALNLLKTQIKAENGMILELESEISTLQLKQKYIRTAQELAELEDVSDPDLIAKKKELTKEAEQILTQLGLTKDTLLNGKTLEEAKAQFEQEENYKNSRLNEKKSYTSKLVDNEGKSFTQINNQLQELNKIKENIQFQLDVLSSSPTEEEKKALYKSLQTLAKTVPDKTYQQTLTLLDLNVRASLSDKITKQIQQQLKQQLSDPLSKPGNSQEIKANLSLGPEFGILSALKVGVTLKGELSYSISVNNDRRINVNNSKLASLSLGANLGPEDVETLSASAKLTGEVQSGKMRTYNTIDDFVQQETSRISTALVQYSSKKNPLNLTSLRQAFRQKQAINLREEARSSELELNRKAKLLGLIATNESLRVPPESKVQFGTTDFRAVSGSGELGLKTGILDLGISGKSKQKSETSTRTIDFLDNMLEHRSPAEIYTQQKPEYVNFAIDEGKTKTVYKGSEGAEKLEILQSSINALKKERGSESEPTIENQYALQELRLQLADALRNLYWEYQEFTQLANRKDSPDTPKEVTQRLETLKKDRGVSIRPIISKGASVGSRAEYLKALSIQYARLANLYYDSFPDGQTPLNQEPWFNGFLQEFKTSLKNPQYYIQQDDLKQVFNAKQIAEGKEISHKAAFTVGRDVISNISGSLSVEVTYSQIVKADNEYTEGKGISVEIKLSGTHSLQDTIKGVIQQINKKTSFNLDESSVDPTIGSSEVQLETSASGKIELSFAENAGSYYLQYARISEERTRDLSANVPIETGQGITLNIGGGVGSTVTRNRWEFMGNNTITYLRDIYTGLKRGERTQDWEQFKTDAASFFRRLFDQLNQANSNAAQEMTENLEKINDPAVTQAWNTALENYRNDKQGKYGELLSAFDRVMNERYQVFKQNSDNRFVNLFKTKDLKEYTNMVLSRAATELAQDYNIPSTVNRDINSLRDWAKNQYVSNANEANFNRLKQAYALDYASNSLSDLLKSQDNIKGKGTTLQLLDGNYIEECR